MTEYYYNQKIIEIDDSPAEVRELLGYWQSKCSPNDIPLKKDITPWEFPRQLGRICIIEVTENPTDFIYRIDGTNTSVSATSDLRNKSILDGDPAEVYQEMYEDLKTSVEMQVPVLWQISYGHDNFEYNYLRLVLPLMKNKPGDTLMTFSYNLETKNGIFTPIR